MLHWLRYPFIRFTPAFIAGIIIYEFLGNPDIDLSVSIISVGFISILFLISIGKKFFSLNPIAGVASLVIMMVAGFTLSSIHFQLNSPNHFSRQSFTHYQGVVDSWR